MRDTDAEFFDRELKSFLPPRVFDAHCHLWRDVPLVIEAEGVPNTCGFREYEKLIQWIHPGRSVAALFLPVPRKSADATVESEWVSGSVAGRSTCRGSYLVRPTDDPEFVRDEVRRLGLHGLKCYHVFADRQPTWEAEIPEYLPEPIVRVAHELGLAITLHMVKSRAAADEGNIHWIRHYCKTYPNMKLILAHSARGFQPAHNLEGLPKLLGFDNLYFDSSANCEPMAHQAVIRIHGHHKLMYGSDFQVSHARGRSLGAADTFLWLYEDSPEWRSQTRRTDPVLVGLEHLRSMKWACWSERLSDSQVEDIFWNNAARLFDVQ